MRAPTIIQGLATCELNIAHSASHAIATLMPDIASEFDFVVCASFVVAKNGSTTADVKMVECDKSERWYFEKVDDQFGKMRQDFPKKTHFWFKKNNYKFFVEYNLKHSFFNISSQFSLGQMF